MFEQKLCHVNYSGYTLPGANLTCDVEISLTEGYKKFSMVSV